LTILLKKWIELIELTDVWRTVSVTKNVIRESSEVRIKFWSMKNLWRRERQYVAILNMEVWLRLARLAPDVPDGWSFPDKFRF
jgi:hypothetical protein